MWSVGETQPQLMGSPKNILLEKQFDKGVRLTLLRYNVRGQTNMLNTLTHNAHVLLVFNTVTGWVLPVLNIPFS